MTDALSFTGVWPILPTPFHGDESLDLDSLARVVRFMAAAGMDGVTVLGVLGEANRLTDAERDLVVGAAVRATDGKLPVVVGTSHAGTRATLDLSRRAADLGAAAVMIAPSHEATPSDERVFEYYRRVAEGLSIPIVLQDHPPSTQVFMPVPLLVRLVEALPSIACIKLEHPPTPRKISALLEAMQGRRVPLLQGLGALYGQFDLERGADGFMTGFGFPEALLALVRAERAGRRDEARALFTRFLPLIVYEQQPGVGTRKEVYRLRGLLTDNKVRHPGVDVDPGTARELAALLAAHLPGIDLTRPLVL